MGACEFGNSGRNGELNVQAAFDELVKNARYENGHGGYSGTIAEKTSFEIVQKTPVTLQAAWDMADKILAPSNNTIESFARGSYRVDKWGAAGAIRVTDAEKKFDGWYFFGLASS